MLVHVPLAGRLDDPLSLALAGDQDHLGEDNHLETGGQAVLPAEGDQFFGLGNIPAGSHVPFVPLPAIFLSFCLLFCSVDSSQITSLY